MLGETNVTPKSNATPTPIITSPNARDVISVHALVQLCAAGIGVGFFLPWLRVFLGKASGFELARQEHRFLWLIPVFALIAYVASVKNEKLKIVALVTGVLPLALLVYGYSDVGKELTELLSVGAYLTIGSALGMLLLAVRMK